MRARNFSRLNWFFPLAVTILLSVGSSGLLAANKKETAAPPPKSAPAAKPASSGGTGSHGSFASGSSTSHSTAPSANHPSANHPTVTQGTGVTTNRLSTGNPGLATKKTTDVRVVAPSYVVVEHPVRISPPTLSAGKGRVVSVGLTGRPAPSGAHSTTLRNGSAVQTRANGRISDIHDAKRGMDMHHGLNGSRRISVERADHSRLVAERGHPGFVERPYPFHEHEFARRTYYDRERVYDRFYRGYSYRGVLVQVYAPSRYYAAGFYGWAYNPWYLPVVYSWGFAGSGWYGYYGGYFASYPDYPNASLWLTDYMISSDLQAEYQAEQATQPVLPQPAQSGVPELTPEVKQEIADEVRNQIALENSEAQRNAQKQDPDPASSGIARMLSDGQSHVFVAGGSLDVVDASGTECALSGGDVLGMSTSPDPNATAIDLVVLSSKGGQECKKSATVTIALNDLQEMQNHMREAIDQGLQELQSKQGKNGLPQAPPSALEAPETVELAKLAPPPDPSGGAEINRQLKDADAAEQEVTAQAQQEAGIIVPPSPAPPAAPARVALGQTVDQVTDALGQPIRVVDLGPKKILQYTNMKVIFKTGKVVDVQ